jgi:serine protease Do
LQVKVVGADPNTDIAVFRVEASNLPAVKLGDDHKLRVGEWVLAIGSPFGPQFEHTVTAGIISAKSRGNVGLADYEDYLQTDAAINPGNSGGPLVNLRGEVIGMNTAIASRSGGSQGVGFAIPITMAQDIMTELMAKGKVTRSQLGVTIQDLSQDLAKGLGIRDSDGILISDVMKDSPADRAGLQEGDVILSMDGVPAGNVPQFRNRVARTKPGETVKLEIMHDDVKKDVRVKLEEKPDERVASSGGSSSDDAPAGLGLELQNLTPVVARQ